MNGAKAAVANGLTYEDIRIQHGLDPDDSRMSLRYERPGPALQCVAEAEWQGRVKLSLLSFGVSREEVMAACVDAAREALREFEKAVGVTV